MTVADNHATDVAERLVWAADAVHASAAISTAHELGVLTVVEAGPVRPQDVAAACQLDEHGTVVLLEALAAMGLVTSDSDGRFGAVPGLSTLGALADIRELLLEAMRSGRAPLDCDVPAGAAQVYPDTVTQLATMFTAAADTVAEVLGGAERILDVGAGAAPWSLALARRNRQCRITAVDFPAVLATTQASVAAAGCSDQFGYLAGDVFELSLPRSSYDLMLLGNVCHLFDEHTNVRLFRRLRPAIVPAGRIAVIDVLPSPEDAVTHRSVALYAAGLMTRTSTGGVHDEESYRAWLSQADLHDIEVHSASQTPPIWLITGCA